MLRRFLSGLLFLVVTSTLVTTCYMEYFDLGKLSDEVELQGDLLAPLVYGSMDMSDLASLLDSAEYIDEFEDGLLYLAYVDTLLAVMADTAVDIPDELVSEVYIDSDIADDPDWVGAPIGSTVAFYKSDLVSFELDGDDRLDSVLVKGGSIEIDVSSSFMHAGILTISSSEILDLNRDTFSTGFVISEPDGTYDSTIVIPSDGYLLITKDSGDSAVVEVHYKLELINSGNPIDPGDECQIETSFNDLGFYRVFGYIDSRNLVEEQGEIDIPIYSDNPDLASLIFADPRLQVYTANSVGVPFEITLENLVATAGDGTEITFEIDEELNPFAIAAPGMDQLGTTEYDTLSINNETSNIDDLLAIAPVALSYEVSGRTDPNTEGNDHFILDTSRFSVAVEFLLPLDLRSSGFALEDTLEFEIGEEGVDTSLVKYARITLSTFNELPIELKTQVYMLNQYHMVLDSVFAGEVPVLAASQVDADGRLMLPSEETSSALFPAEKLALLEEVRFLLVRASLLTSELGGQFVKFYADYTLDYEISMDANVRINTREL
jgi:hypothetical protein